MVIFYVSKKNLHKIVSLLLVIGCLMSESVLAEKQKEPEAQTLYSKSCAMVDGDSGRLLYGKRHRQHCRMQVPQKF